MDPPSITEGTLETNARRPLTLPQCVTLACLLEATTPKPGNVHRGADFEDLSFFDFVVSSVAIGEAIASAGSRGIGHAVLQAVDSTQSCVGTNTNLGTILLLAPLAAAPAGQTLPQAIPFVLASLHAQDAAHVYEAIRRAKPGGLGHAARMDVHASAPADLMLAMNEAASRDLVARQYVNGFAQVFGVARQLARLRNRGWRLSDAVVHAHLQLMADFPDSLIQRKCGEEIARASARMAAAVLAQGGPANPVYLGLLADLDFWLRSDGHRRNPGTSADLIAAGLFAALRDELIAPPYR